MSVKIERKAVKTQGEAVPNVMPGVSPTLLLAVAVPLRHLPICVQRPPLRWRQRHHGERR